MGDGSLVTPWRRQILSILLKAGRGISVETCGLADVFPPHDPSSVSETLCKFINIFGIMDASYLLRVRLF